MRAEHVMGAKQVSRESVGLKHAADLCYINEAHNEITLKNIHTLNYTHLHEVIAILHYLT